MNDNTYNVFWYLVRTFFCIISVLYIGIIGAIHKKAEHINYATNSVIEPQY